VEKTSPPNALAGFCREEADFFKASESVMFITTPKSQPPYDQEEDQPTQRRK